MQYSSAFLKIFCSETLAFVLVYIDISMNSVNSVILGNKNLFFQKIIQVHPSQMYVMFLLI